MCALRFVRTRPIRSLPQRQNGQALIYGLFMLIGSATALFFLFNTGQLASEKTKLVNTADAVAYSAAVMHARALNFDAYSNRALMANEVLVAQMVSLSSWTQYAKMHVEQVPLMFPECADPRLAVGDALQKFDAAYATMCFILTVPESPVAQAVATLSSAVPPAAQALVDAIEGTKTAIKSAESLLHAPAYFTQIRANLMQEVADRNYAGDGSVSVRGVNALAVPGAGPVDDVLAAFVGKYEGEDRTRFAEAVSRAAGKKEFVNSRNWVSKSLLPPWRAPVCAIKGRNNSVRRSGGTSLIGLDEWKSEDTESYWNVHDRYRWFSWSCVEDEYPIAWGEQHDFSEAGEQDASGARLGNSPKVNPSAHGMASSASWSNYSGIPAYYDLSPTMLESADPRLSYSVKLVREAGATRTSGGASIIRPSAHLNNFANGFAGGVMSAVATGEVYFERPWFNEGNYSYSTGDMVYVVTKNQSDTTAREIGSLFNPYWQVRLAPNNKQALKAEQAGQGAGMPE